jgi:hypothetical protein
MVIYAELERMTEEVGVACFPGHNEEAMETSVKITSETQTDCLQ